jgi:GTPase
MTHPHDDLHDDPVGKDDLDDDINLDADDLELDSDDLDADDLDLDSDDLDADDLDLDNDDWRFEDDDEDATDAGDQPHDDDDEEARVSKRRALHDTAETVERVILVGVTKPQSQKRYETDEHLDELALLSETAGAEVIESVLQNRASIVPSTFIGKGKAEYLQQRCEDANVNTVIFDDDLTPVQQRNLERMISRKVIDRTTLILHIFAMHARTNTAKTQVELAQLEYLLPRLTGMWTHFSKQYGGIRTKGPGETQIETDRRLVRDRITHLRAKLAKIDRQRATQRKARAGTTRAALVGYTNVGKSTLLNILTGAGVLAENKLFATLDSTVRSMELGKNTVLLTDTVGFIRKLPTKLVASFKSTLDEVVESDIILHVVDVSHPAFADQIDVVMTTLKDIGAEGRTVITVFNKIDALDDTSGLAALRERYPNPVFISAARGINLGELLAVLQRIVDERTTHRTFAIAPPDYGIAAQFHQHAEVVRERYGERDILISCIIQPDAAERLLKLHTTVSERDDVEEEEWTA